MKILWASTSTAQSTGYARIGHVCITDLANRGHAVYHMAFQNYPGSRVDDRPLPPSVTVIDVHTRATDTFGVDILREVLAEVQPDLFVIYNDSVVTCRFLNELLGIPKPCPIVAYCDFVYDFQLYTLIEHIDHYVDSIVLYSRYWVDHLTRMGLSPEKLRAFPHGVDAATFYPVDKADARARLNLPADDFLVMNTNRNSYRKFLDVTIKAFLLFWKAVGCASTVKLVLNTRADIEEGYDVHHVIRTACFLYGLDPDAAAQHVLTIGGAGTSGLLADRVVNDLYNACDLGLNTCGGEGFGLTNAEMAFLGKPQIVTRVGGLADTFGAFSRMCVEPVTHITIARNIDSHSGELAIVRPEDVAAKIQAYYDSPTSLKEDGEMLARHFATTCHWPSLLEAFHTHLLEVVTRRWAPVPIYWINLEARTDRRAHMERQLQTLHAQEHTRIPACVVDDEPHIACMRSHDAALRAAFADGHDLVCICEDDVIFPPDFDARLHEVLQKLPMGWDCCQLHAVSPGVYEHLHATSRPQQLCRGYLMSAACYVFTRKGLKRYFAVAGSKELALDLSHPKARAEELVFRYVSASMTLYPLVRTDETLGSSIPENAGTGLNARNDALLATLHIPKAWNSRVLELPYDLHFVETADHAARLFPPRLLVIIPGFGSPELELKTRLVRANLASLRASAAFASVDVWMMQYDATPQTWEDDLGIEDDLTPFHRPAQKLGAFLAQDCRPADLPPHDLVLLLLDDIEILDDPWNDMVRALQYCDVVSPTLSPDSKCVYPYMRGGDPDSEDIRIGPACEFFCYMMTPAAYSTWHAHVASDNPWCWGLDLLIGQPLGTGMGLRVGRLPSRTMRHHLAGTAYGPDDAPMTDCLRYLQKHTSQTYEALVAAADRVDARVRFT